MKLDTQAQRFVTKLHEIATEDQLPENISRYSDELIAEVGRLVRDDENDTTSTEFLDHIEYGLVDDELPWGPSQTFGFKVKGKNELISELLHAFENLIATDLPTEISEYAPTISQDEWKAVIRMTIDIVTALDRPVLRENSKEASFDPASD